MNPTLIVMRKELREMFRDKRVRNNAIIMPMLLILGMLSLFGFISGVGEKSNQKVHVVKASNSLVDKLKAEKIQVVMVATQEEGEKLIREGKARLLLVFAPDFDQKLQAGQQTRITAEYDPQEQTAHLALAAVQEQLMPLNAAVASKVLRAHGVPEQALVPAQLDEKQITVGKEGVNEFLVSLLPYFIVIWAFYGGFGTASDLVAGEKEKSTLETLLITPIGRSQIAFGKFLALSTVCACSSLSAVAGVIIAGVSGAPIYAKLFPQGLGFGLPEIATIIIVLIPTVAFFASLLIAVSTYAKNSREAQGYLAIISFVVLMPAIFGQVIGLTDLASNWWIRLIPVLNTSVTVREALQGKTSWSGLAITVAVGALLAFIGIRIAVHLFKREQVLTRV